MKALFMAMLMAATRTAAQEYSPYLLAVDEYLPAPGQFINTMPEASMSDTPLTMAARCTEALANNNGGLVCLGSFGGYMTFHFDHPVANVAGKRDLYIKGNAIAGNAEPGIVMVSQDSNGNGLPDDRWYELSGSADVDSLEKVTYGYRITYTRTGDEVSWEDNQGVSGSIVRSTFHKQDHFPLWVEEESLTFSGTRLPDNGHDMSGRGAYWVLDALRRGYVDNLPNTDVEGCSLDIDDAVDDDRQPVKLGHIDFVRIYSATRQQCGWIGETSTEVAGAEDLHLQASLDYLAGMDGTKACRTVTSMHGLDGTRRHTMHKGINILHYDDGTSRTINYIIK